MAYWTVRRVGRREKGPKMQCYLLPQQRVHESSGLGVREEAERLRTPLADFFSLLLRGHAPVDHIHAPGAVATLIACQEEHQAGDLLR